MKTDMNSVLERRCVDLARQLAKLGYSVPAAEIAGSPARARQYQQFIKILSDHTRKTLLGKAAQ